MYLQNIIETSIVRGIESFVPLRFSNGFLCRVGKSIILGGSGMEMCAVGNQIMMMMMLDIFMGGVWLPFTRINSLLLQIPSLSLYLSLSFSASFEVTQKVMSKRRKEFKFASERKPESSINNKIFLAASILVFSSVFFGSGKLTKGVYGVFSPIASEHSFKSTGHPSTIHSEKMWIGKMILNFLILA